MAVGQASLARERFTGDSYFIVCQVDDYDHRPAELEDYSLQTETQFWPRFEPVVNAGGVVAAHVACIRHGSLALLVGCLLARLA